MMKRILSAVLAACLLIALAPAAHALNGMNELKAVRILAWQGEHQLLDIYQDTDDLLMRAEDLSWLTDHTYTEYSDIFSFTRGSKTVKVDAKSNVIYLAGAQYGINLENKCHKIDGVWYLPAASVLPWLNTHIVVRNGALLAVPNLFSLWDIIDEFELADYQVSQDDLLAQTNIILKGGSTSRVLNEGLGAIYYLAGDSQNSNMGEELDYYNLFFDMIEDVSATDVSVKPWIDEYDFYGKNLDFLGTGFSFWDETIGEGFDTKGITYSKEALTLLSYICSFRKDGANKVKTLQSLVDGADASSNSGMISAALDVIENYTDRWEGIQNTVIHQVITNLPDEATSGTIFGMFGFINNLDKSTDTQIKRIPLYYNIMAEAMDGYRCYTGETELHHLEDYVNYIILYLYSVEQNYRAMAAYEASGSVLPGLTYYEYLEKADKTESEIAKFLSISFLLKDDCSDFALKRERTTELKEAFTKVNPDVVPYGVTAVAENAMYWATVMDANIPFYAWDMADMDLDGQQELLIECNDSELFYLVIDPNDITTGKCLPESYDSGLYLRQDSSGRYYIRKDNDAGTITDTLVWNGKDFVPAESDTLQAAQLPSADMTEQIFAGNTKQLLKQMKRYFKSSRFAVCKETDLNGDGTDDLIMLVWQPVDYWTNLRAGVDYGGYDVSDYEGERITVLVAETQPEGVKLRLTRVDNPGYASDFTVDPENRTVTVGDTVYAYRETGKPVVVQGNSYGICAADLLGMSADQIRPLAYDFNMDSTGAATAWYKDDTFLEMTFSGNGSELTKLGVGIHVVAIYF